MIAECAKFRQGDLFNPGTAGDRTSPRGPDGHAEPLCTRSDGLSDLAESEKSQTPAGQCADLSRLPIGNSDDPYVRKPYLCL